MPTEPFDPAAVIASRRAANAERVRRAQARWERFQAASARRYATHAKRRPPAGLMRLLARGKRPGRMLLLSASGVWDAGLDTSLGSVAGPTATLDAYVRAGPDPAAQPRALFDQAWYLDQAAGLAGSQWAPLAHYLVVGDRHGLSPHPLLDAPAYRARHGAEMAVRGLTALEHFLFAGAAKGLAPHPLFDVAYYVGQSDALADSGENPLIHYLRTGWREGLDPHPLFAGAWYLDQNPDAAAAGVAPLLHYVLTGAAQDRDPHPLFDTAHSRKQARSRLRGADALSDYLRSAARDVRSPSPHFDQAFYLDQAGGVAAARANPLLHYLTVGAWEGLWPAPNFDEAAYFATHPQAATAPMSGLEHWVRNRTAERPANAAAGERISAQTLFNTLRRATEPDPDAYGNEAYAALRPARAPDAEPVPVRVIALRRTTPPDWTAVARALPSYLGHLQPRIPADGFTDPGDAATLARDVALAERYGLAGFCHQVSDAAQAEAATAVDFPFCLAWSGAPDPAVARILSRPHAIRIGDRPVVLLASDADIAAWRALDPGLFLVQHGGHPVSGFDAYIGEPIAARAPEGPPGAGVNPDFRGLVHDAQALIAGRMAEVLADGAFPLVVAARDTTPLSQDAPVIWHGAVPGGLQAWLEHASAAVRGRAPERRLVFVHAWNDWETGAALAPDLRFGHGWLEAITNAADADLLTP